MLGLAAAVAAGVEAAGSGLVAGWAGAGTALTTVASEPVRADAADGISTARTITPSAVVVAVKGVRRGMGVLLGGDVAVRGAHPGEGPAGT
ncbi:hypothetical protein Cs7R123_79090 [Catellatospora sp. TT07R-123]|nr:hypothetical protein Cs7R123_79090 [Catellatospora sp. TT07R-123]